MRRSIASLTVVVALLTLLAPTALAGGSGAAQYALNPGWDVFGQPLTMGKVILNSPDTTGKLGVTFVLSGATPNHTYIVGAHFFNGTGVTPLPSDVGSYTSDPGYFGAGWWVDGTVNITRQGTSADVIAYDFGYLTTDAYGNGSVHFNLFPTLGTYAAEFTVRIGPVCNVHYTNPDTAGCPVVFQSGTTFGYGLADFSL